MESARQAGRKSKIPFCFEFHPLPSVTLFQPSMPELSERIVSAVPVPRTWFPKDSDLWEVVEGHTVPNVAFLQQHFHEQGRLDAPQVSQLTKEAIGLLEAEPNLLEVPAPTTVFGDIHGQFYDLEKAFSVAGGTAKLLGGENWLFLGDYVDRGCFSVECFLLLLAMKIRFPRRVFLLRGNHESRHLTAYFTFKREALFKYGEQEYEVFCQAFEALPVAAIVDGRFFCVHGGLSPELMGGDGLERLAAVNRRCEAPRRSLLQDLLWSDPHPAYGTAGEPADFFVQNRARGCSYYFSFSGCCAFLKRHGLLSVIRGHEAQESGYRLFRKESEDGFPTCVTLFSAPNYVDTYRNQAAILCYNGKTMNLRQFNARPHPYTLPNFQDAIAWSAPFISEKIVQALFAICRMAQQQATPEEIAIAQQSQRSSLLTKIRAVGRMQRKLAVLRSEHEAIGEFRSLCRDSAGSRVSLPAGCLDVARDQLRSELRSFAAARISDAQNEKLPQAEDSMQPIAPLESERPPEITAATETISTLGGLVEILK